MFYLRQNIILVPIHVIDFEFNSYMKEVFILVPTHAVVCKKAPTIYRSYSFINLASLTKYDLII